MLFARHGQDPWQILTSLDCFSAAAKYERDTSVECLVFMKKSRQALWVIERSRYRPLSRQSPAGQALSKTLSFFALNLRTNPCGSVLVVPVVVQVSTILCIRLPYSTRPGLAVRADDAGKGGFLGFDFDFFFGSRATSSGRLRLSRTVL